MFNAIQTTTHSTQQWMIVAFIAGIIFAAVLAQTVMMENKDFSGTRQLPASSGEQDSLTPALIPDDNYLQDFNLYALAYTSPEWKAM
jgi:hypothetical protein